MFCFLLKMAATLQMAVLKHYLSQILNVYVSKYESGGQFWPIAHNTTIFAMVVAQIIALGVFGLKESPVASGFTIPLIIGTLLFHEYCRQRFGPIFKNTAAEVAELENGTRFFLFLQVFNQPCYCFFRCLLKWTGKMNNVVGWKRCIKSCARRIASSHCWLNETRVRRDVRVITTTKTALSTLKVQNQVTV